MEEGARKVCVKDFLAREYLIKEDLSMGNGLNPLDFESLIDKDNPKHHPVTEQTLAHCMWNGMFAQRGPFPKDLSKEIMPRMSRKEIEMKIARYLKIPTVIDHDWENGIDRNWTDEDRLSGWADQVDAMTEKAVSKLKAGLKKDSAYERRQIFFNNLRKIFHFKKG